MLAKRDLLRSSALAALAVAAGPIAALAETYDQTQKHASVQEDLTCIGVF